MSKKNQTKRARIKLAIKHLEKANAIAESLHDQSASSAILEGLEFLHADLEES